MTDYPQPTPSLPPIAASQDNMDGVLKLTGLVLYDEQGNECLFTVKTVGSVKKLHSVKIEKPEGQTNDAQA